MQPQRIIIGMGKPTFPIPEHFLAMGHEFARRGNLVQFLVHHHNPVAEKNGNPSYHFWSWGKGSFTRRIKDFFWLYRFFTKHRPSIVIAGNRDTKMMVLVGYLLRIPVRVFYYRTLSSQIDLDSPISKFGQKIRRLIRIPIYRWTPTAVVGESSAAITDLQTVYCVPPSKCKMFHMTLCDPLKRTIELNKIDGLPEERIICVGRMDFSKGQDVLLRAIKPVFQRYPRLKVYLIGDGPYLDRFITLSRDLGVNKQCVFTRAIPHQEVMSFVASSSITIIPSREDNLPTTVIEALSLGVPVIASRVGGITDIFTDGLEGLLVSPGDPNALADAILWMLANPDQREVMVKAARARFLDHFQQQRGVIQQVQWFEAMVDAMVNTATTKVGS